jgi:uncharacterized protein DUF3383
MSDLDDVVQVVITDQTTAIATASFAIPLILATFTNFAERTRTYQNIAEVGGDFATTSNVYKMASQLLGQSSVIGATPPSIVVGRRQVDTVVFTPTVADNTTYTVTLNGTPYTFTSGAGATATTIVTGLKAAIGTPTGITVSGTTTLSLAPTVQGTAWSVGSSTNLVAVNTASETWPAALVAVDAENDIWYALTAETQVAAEQEALSDTIQAMDKIYGLSSSDVVAPTTGTTDVGYKLEAKNAGRTFGVYSATSATEFPAAAWLGSQLAVTPGSNDWDFKRANGVTRSILSSTQIVNLRAKSWNFFRRKGGLDVFQDGNMFDGKPIDIQISKDWLKARLQEGIYFRIINSLKIPMTDPGLLIVENEIRSVLSLAESNGMIDSGWTVQTPPVLSIPATLRAQRAAGVFVIRARLAGAIRSVSINFYLSV